MRYLSLVLAASASAQVVNGGFEIGSFPPWVLANTPQGGSIFSGVGDYDIDGPGPLPTSKAASCMVGRSSPGTTPEGITISQDIQLTAGSTYNLSFNWSVRALVNAFNSSGGTFELLVNGAVLNQGSAPVLAANSAAYGQVSASFTPQQTGAHALTIRITRTVGMGEEIVQHLDNVTATIPCYPNCDNSTITPVLNVADFTCFLNKFAGADSYANCDASTVAPILNVADFTCFLNRFAAGCS